MNILILNWRDPKNPKSGGAEKLNVHILQPFLERGDLVTWYSMSSQNLPRVDMVKGIRVVREGNILTHYLMWPFFLWSGRFGKIDLIIDSIHGTGYLSLIFAPSTQKIILICEVAQNIWDEMYPIPINIIGKIWEKAMFWLYRGNKFWTISQSTKDDLIKFGIKSKNIEVLPMGFDGVKIKNTSKSQEPTALFVGRLNEMKGIKDAIRAVASVNYASDKKWSLNIIGRGELSYEKELKGLVDSLKMNEYITFLGFVSEAKKFEEMAKAWVLLVSSSREGWGMIVPEANSVGTPVIGYDVSGLRDVMRAYSKKNIVVDSTVEGLAKALKSIRSPTLLKDKPGSGWSNLYRFIKVSI